MSMHPNMYIDKLLVFNACKVKATYRAEEDDKKVYVSDNVMEQLIIKDLKDPNLDVELEQEFSDEVFCWCVHTCGHIIY